MRVEIEDSRALAAISPGSLSAYARDAGWVRNEPYGDHSDVYTSDRAGHPEIVLPRTQALGDYAAVVSRLIGIFASAADTDQLSVYRDLTTADRDVIRIRAVGDDSNGNVPIGEGVDLINGAYAMVLSAACSVNEARPVHRAGANRDAVDLTRKMRFGQTEQGSFVLTVLTPMIPPPIQQTRLPGCEPDDEDDELMQRRITKQLAQSLRAARQATELTNTGHAEAFGDAVPEGVSANLCESLVKLIQPFSALETIISWARTRPMGTTRSSVRFTDGDVPILEEAARTLRSRAPKPNVQVIGHVERLKRRDDEAGGAIVFKGLVDSKHRSVTTLLNTSDYERAIQAHRDKTPRRPDRRPSKKSGQRWQLLNARDVKAVTE